MVKAAALPKRRAAAAASAVTAAVNGCQTSSVEEEGPPVLWDLTAGLGTDAFVLALAGWRVEMFERSAVVAAMVQVRSVRWTGAGMCVVGEGGGGALRSCMAVVV